MRFQRGFDINVVFRTYFASNVVFNLNGYCRLFIIPESKIIHAKIPKILIKYYTNR